MSKIGEKVQAVDKIGRWETGRVIANVGKPTAKFLGWDDSFSVHAEEEKLSTVHCSSSPYIVDEYE